MNSLRQPDWIDRLLAFHFRRGWPGFLTLQRWLRRTAVNRRTRYGAVLALHPGDYVDEIVLREGYYESEVFEAMRPFLRPGAVLWDIGGNLGLHCLSAALTCPGLEVHAFEPSPAMHARLRAHAERNGVALHCWEIALGDRDGAATLHVNATGNPGMTTLVPYAAAQYDARVEVPLARGDSLVARGRLPAPNLIKLDVEGGEAAVLTGLGALLRSPTLRAVVFETRADLLADPQACPAARQLLAAGFELVALSRVENSAHALGNFLACRPA